jgi:transposase
MKKNTTAKKTTKQAKGVKVKVKARQLAAKQRLTVGIDLGDKTSRYCILDEAGEVVSEEQIPTIKAGLDSLFAKMPASRIAIEVGTHSPWVSRHLASLGHEVIVANAHKVKLITQNIRKNDRIDARHLARLARLDPKLLSPIQHRGEQAQRDLAMIRGRAELISARTKLVNAARGLVKPLGERLKKCDADQVNRGLGENLSEGARAIVEPLLKAVEAISEQLDRYDEQIDKIAKRYPEVKLLQQVYGVGPLIAMTYVLTLEDAQRFAHSRDVGPYLGLTPKQRDSGDSQPELSISKAGDGLLRSLLVQGAHCILRKNAPDSDLRTWGLGKMGESGKGGKGGTRAKKRAVVAVARRLAVLLHHLWATGEVYDPHYNRKAAEAAAAKAKGKGKVAA